MPINWLISCWIDLFKDERLLLEGLHVQPSSLNVRVPIQSIVQPRNEREMYVKNIYIKNVNSSGEKYDGVGYVKNVKIRRERDGYIVSWLHQGHPSTLFHKVLPVIVENGWWIVASCWQGWLKEVRPGWVATPWYSVRLDTDWCAYRSVNLHIYEAWIEFIFFDIIQFWDFE